MIDTGEDAMKAIRIVAILLIVAGILILTYGGFTYTKSTHEAKIGPVELSVRNQHTVNVPMWAGTGAIVLGGILLLLPISRRK
jgi:TRAP-type C4-dicarboxylate transport system permease small subunit